MDIENRVKLKEAKIYYTDGNTSSRLIGLPLQWVRDNNCKKVVISQIPGTNILTIEPKDMDLK